MEIIISVDITKSIDNDLTSIIIIKEVILDIKT